MRIPTCTRVQSRFGEGLENRPEGCAGGCFVVGRTSEGKTWWPLVAAFIRGGTLRIPFEISPLSFFFFPLPPPSPFLSSSFTSIVHVSTYRCTTSCSAKGAAREREKRKEEKKKKKKHFPLRILAVKGTAFVSSFHLIFPAMPGEKIVRPVFTPTFGYLETHYRAPLPRARSTAVSEKFPRFHGYTRVPSVLCAAHKGATNDTAFVSSLFRLSRRFWWGMMAILRRLLRESSSSFPFYSLYFSFLFVGNSTLIKPVIIHPPESCIVSKDRVFIFEKAINFLRCCKKRKEEKRRGTIFRDFSTANPIFCRYYH